MHPAHGLAAGVKALPGTDSSLASTQAAWRFWHNERVTLEALAEPLLMEAQRGMAQGCDRYALLVHDWSRISYSRHSSKADRRQMTHCTDVGYELQTALLISDRDGQPLAPMVQNLVTAKTTWSSRGAVETSAHLEELTQRVAWLDARASKPMVHIVDREGDSVGHWRLWTQQGARWLVRARKTGRVRLGDQTCSVERAAAQIPLIQVGSVAGRDGPAAQWVGHADIVLERPAAPRHHAGPKRPAQVAGPPLAARLIVSRLIHPDGRLLAEWFLISNVPDVPAVELARWYYWRWRIESFFKLLKSQGLHLEQWQQETGLAIAKRLLVASMACVCAWRLAADSRPPARKLAAFLVRLSGRQMKRSQPVTPSALLAGLWTYLSCLELLNHHSPEELRELAQFLPFQLGLRSGNV